MRAPAAVLLSLLAPLSATAATARHNLLGVINEIRAQGCERRAGVEPALRTNPALDRVARALAEGRSVQQAMADADYRAVQSATLEVTGGDETIASLLARRGCKDIVDPVYREVGLVRRGGRAWIVLAAPLVPPPASQARMIHRQVLALVNEARSRPRRCGWKRFGATAPLELSDALHRAALAHARDMATRSEMSHAGGDGSTPAERATRAGYRWRVVAENVAAGQATPEQVVAEWVRSPRHCSNLMDPDFSEMGVAYAAEPGSVAGIYWAQVFAAPR